MSPWTEKQSPRWPLVLGTVLILAGLIGGVLLMAGGSGDDEAEPPAGTGPPSMSASSGVTGAAATPGDEDPADGPRVVDWGVAAGQLAVVVRNDTRKVIDAARVRITATDAQGATVLSTTGTADDVCCTIVGLPPNQDFGLFAPLAEGDAAAAIADVAVDYVSVESGRSGSRAWVGAADGELHVSGDDTTVTTTLTAHGAVDGYVAAQAILVDREGKVAQLISGRFYCFEAGSQRRVRMQLFHAVPEHLRLGRVLAYALPDDVPSYVPEKCS